MEWIPSQLCVMVVGIHLKDVQHEKHVADQDDS